MPLPDPALQLAQARSARWSQRTIFALLGLLAFMPLAYGAVEAWSELVALLGGALLALAVVVRRMVDPLFQLPRARWAIVLAGLWLGLIVWQLIPLPAALYGRLHPRASAVRAELRAIPPVPQVSAPTTETISWRPIATEHGLRMALLAITLFGVAACSVQREADAQLLLLGVFVIGVGEAALGIAQHLTGAKGIYWSEPVGPSLVVTAGSFINYSHFCQFVNMALGCGVGLLLAQLERERRGFAQQSWDRWSALAASREARWAILAGVVLCAVAVFTSMGRNGALTLLATAVVAGLLLSFRESLSWRRWLLIAIPLLVLGVLLLSGFDLVYNRLATLEQRTAFRDRWQLTLGAVDAWRENPWFGAGLAAHEAVFPRFDRTTTTAVAGHADNDYAQLLEEMGVAGVLLLVVLIVVMARLLYRLLRYGAGGQSIAAYGILMGLLAAVGQSTTDFGQRIPAIFGLTGTLAGLVVGLTHLEEQRQLPPHFVPQLIVPHRRRFSTGLLAVGLLAAWGWALSTGYRHSLGETWEGLTAAIASRIEANPVGATDDDYYDLLAAAEGAVETDPRDPHRQWVLNSARWRSVSRFTDPETGAILLHPNSIPHIENLAAETAAARHANLTFGPLYALEGELRTVALEEPQGQRLVQQAAKLAPTDAAVNFTAGEFAAAQGEALVATQFLTRAARLHPGFFPAAAQVLIQDLDQLAVARELAKDNYARLIQIADLCAAQPNQAADAEQLRAEATKLLEQRVKAGQATAPELAELGRLATHAGELDQAIIHYSAALTQAYGRVDWRLTMAELMSQQGRYQDALSEARTCLRIRPGYPPAQKLADEMSLKIQPEE